MNMEKDTMDFVSVIESIFIINRNMTLVGVADLRDILAASPATLLKDLMDTD